ncbi:MAG: hypothetical protein Q9168_003465 [Polycauliona sp. 1 TL-2023]
MGRMIYNFTDRARLLGIKAWRFTLYFVVLDIVAFIIQISGAASASGQDIPKDDILRGLHIYMGGVGLQQIFVLVFCYIAFRFQQQLRQGSPGRLSQALLLLYVEYAALLLITVGIILNTPRRLANKSVLSTIPNHEVYQYVFDTLPMLLALVIFNVVHPGRIMPGKESDFPSRKERKVHLKANATPNSQELLPTHVPMPNENAFQQTPQVVPSHGFIQ